MITTERALYALLLVVAAAAAVLSFDALRGLALLCGFAPWLAWLLPVTIDAGAGAGAVAWLGRHDGAGRRFGRWLALALLATSVAGNALGHALAAYATRPHWGVVVAVSAVAPAVLGAVVHLAVLVARAGAGPGEALAPTPRDRGPVVAMPANASAPPVDHPTSDVPDATEPAKPADLIAAGFGRKRLAEALDISPTQARQLIDQHRAVTNGKAR